jgi:hypothetical protein
VNATLDHATLLSGSQVNGKTSLSFSRTLSTGDTKQDIAITSGPLLMQWYRLVMRARRSFVHMRTRNRCYHTNDNFFAGETHNMSGSLVMSLLNLAPMPATPAIANVCNERERERVCVCARARDRCV